MKNNKPNQPTKNYDTTYSRCVCDQTHKHPILRPSWFVTLLVFLSMQRDYTYRLYNSFLSIRSCVFCNNSKISLYTIHLYVYIFSFPEIDFDLSLWKVITFPQISFNISADTGIENRFSPVVAFCEIHKSHQSWTFLIIIWNTVFFMKDKNVPQLLASGVLTQWIAWLY